MRISFGLAFMALLFVAGFSTLVTADDKMGMGKNVSEMSLQGTPGLPTCAVASVQSGDPAKGPSIIYAELEAGCIIPWHWHTPAEHLMIISGTARIEMKGGKSLTLNPGGYAMMPSKHVHQFRCEKGCSLYVSSNAAFDIQYVDGQGNEMSPADALKAVNEIPFVPPEKQ